MGQTGPSRSSSQSGAGHAAATTAQIASPDSCKCRTSALSHKCNQASSQHFRRPAASAHAHILCVSVQPCVLFSKESNTHKEEESLHSKQVRSKSFHSFLLQQCVSAFSLTSSSGPQMCNSLTSTLFPSVPAAWMPTMTQGLTLPAERHKHSSSPCNSLSENPPFSKIFHNLFSTPKPTSKSLLEPYCHGTAHLAVLVGATRDMVW